MLLWQVQAVALAAAVVLVVALVPRVKTAALPRAAMAKALVPASRLLVTVRAPVLPRATKVPVRRAVTLLLRASPAPALASPLCRTTHASARRVLPAKQRRHLPLLPLLPGSAGCCHSLETLQSHPCKKGVAFLLGVCSRFTCLKPDNATCPMKLI